MKKLAAHPAVILAALALAAQPAAAQETVEGRLLQVLKDKGIIDDREFSELRDLEQRLREESDLDSRIDARIEEMISRVQDAPPTTGYRQGRGFHWTTADNRFKLHVGGRLQVRFSLTQFHTHDVDPDLEDDVEPNFDVPRARVWLRGHAWQDYLRYKFQFDIAGEEADDPVSGRSPNRLVEMKDAHVDFTKWKAFQIRAGQFKVPYSRHQLASSGSLQFVDRAGTDRVFAPGRDVGVMVYGTMGGEDEDMFEYYAGAFDGEGENLTNNDEGLLFAGRLVLNPFGGVRYSESDTGHTEDFRMAVAVNAWIHQDDNHVEDEDDWSIGADVAIFWKGLFVLGEFHYQEIGVSGAPDVEITGFVVQAGYFVTREFEVGGRIAKIDWENNGGGNSARREYLGVLGYFWHEHRLKLQLDFGWIEDHDGDLESIDQWVLRMQFQIFF